MFSSPAKIASIALGQSLYLLNAIWEWFCLFDIPLNRFWNSKISWSDSLNFVDLQKVMPYEGLIFDRI